MLFLQIYSPGTTEVMHNVENMTLVDHCPEPGKILHFILNFCSSPKIGFDLYFQGCYEKAIAYSYPDGDTEVPIPMSQIESLIQLSEFCDQQFQYDCTVHIGSTDQ